MGAKQGTNNTQQQNEQKGNGKGQGKTKFKGTCNYCSKHGYKQETGATAISDKSTEFLLYAGVEYGMMSTKNMFPDSYDLLQTPEIWIGDTAATTDMTPHRKGMNDVTNPPGDVHVIMGNKQVEKSTAIGSISSIVCDNQGNQKFNVKMTDVALVPDCAFNLFSFTKRLKKGWSLHGNADALTLISPDGACKLRFDIKITTPNGVLYAICMKRTHAEHANVVTNGNKNEKMTKVSVLQAHEKLGHIYASDYKLGEYTCTVCGNSCIYYYFSIIRLVQFPVCYLSTITLVQFVCTTKVSDNFTTSDTTLLKLT